MPTADLFKGIGLYFGCRNRINMFGMVRKDQAVAESVREGGVPAGIDDDGGGSGGLFRLRQGQVKPCAAGKNAGHRRACEELLGVITHLAF